MVDIFSKYAAILYSFIKAPLTKHKGSGSGNVLIIEGGHIGDVIMDASALIYLAEHYVKAGKNVYFLCSPPLWDMLKRISNMNGVQYVGNDYSYDSRHQHYDSFWKSFAQLKEKNYELIISIQNTDLRIHCMVACLTASEKWGVITQSNSHGIRGCVKSLLLKCYTNIVWGDRRKFQLRRMEQLVRELQIGLSCSKCFYSAAARCSNQIEIIYCYCGRFGCCKQALACAELCFVNFSVIS